MSRPPRATSDFDHVVDDARRLGVSTPTADDVEVARVREVLEARWGLSTVVTASRIGRFMVLDRVGSGAMGVVYRGYDDNLDRSVAIKLLHATLDSPALRERLLREARALARVSSANVATVYESGEHGGRAYVAMEFIRGRTLRQWQAQERPDLRAILRAYVGAGRGLAAAHAAGLVHRDFKPDNAMVAEAGVVKVLDFGLARGSIATEPDGPTQDGDAGATEAELDATPLTRSGALVGTPAYMAPEALAGGSADAKSDQFSFCVALHEALWGVRPFAGKTLDALALAIAQGRATRPKAKDREIPAWVRQAVTRGLSADPAARWPTIDALVETLARGRDRAARLRVATAAVLLLVLVSLAVIWQATAGERRVAACVENSATLAGTWDDDSRRRMGDGMTATGAAFVGQTLGQVERHLDRYAERWTQLRTDACELVRTTDEVAQRLAAASDACFEDRRDALSSLVEVLAVADAQMIGHAVGAATSLPMLDACRDQGALLASRASSSDADSEDLTAIRGQLRTAATLESMGEFDKAFAEADAALVIARRAGIDVATADALSRVGTLQSRRGNNAEAEAALEEAFHLAARVGDDATAGEAATELAWTVGYQLARREEGLRWGELAQTMFEREGDPAGTRTAALLDTVGSIRDDMGDHAGALADFERALALREQALGPDHMLVAASVGNLSLALGSLGRTDEALAGQRRALAIYLAELGEDNPWTGQSRTAIAGILASAGRLTDARDEFARVVSIYEKSLAPDHKYIADAIGNLGNVEQELGNLDEALALQRRAVAIYETSLAPDHPQLASGWLNLSSIETTMGRFDDAATHARRSYELRVVVFGPQDVNTARARFNLAEAELGRGAVDAAIEHFAALVEPRDDAPLPAELVDLAAAGLARARRQAGEHRDEAEHRR